MRFFIDTANIEEIKEANDLGVICGVTTNPSLIAKEGRDFIEVVKEISEIVPFTVVTNHIKYIGVTLTKQVKICMTRTSSLWRKKSKKISEDGKISHVHGLAGLI